MCLQLEGQAVGGRHLQKAGEALWRCDAVPGERCLWPPQAPPRNRRALPRPGRRSRESSGTREAGVGQEEGWRVARKSREMIVPLISGETLPGVLSPALCLRKGRDGP